MKRIIIASAIALCTISTYATATIDADVVTTQVATQEYAEVSVSDLPQPVKEAVAKEFEGATISKAYKNDKGEYKLIVSTTNEKSKTLHVNSKGEWIKKQ